MSIHRKAMQIATFPILAITFLPVLTFFITQAQQYKDNVEWLATAETWEWKTAKGEWVRLEVAVYELTGTMVQELVNNHDGIYWLAEMVTKRLG